MNIRPPSDLIARSGATLCVECGKCVALCPMAETSPGFSRSMSPRGIVQQVLRGLPISDMPGVAACLQCGSCSASCPAGVDVTGLIAGLRALLPAPAQHCAGCGVPLLPGDAESYLKKTVNQGFETVLDYADLCPRCRRRAYIRNNS